MSTTAAAPPLTENTHIKELLTILADNNMNTAAKEFISMIGYIGAMERQLDTAAAELQTIRQELGAMRDAQNHPLRTALQNAARSLEAKIAEARVQLNYLKLDIIEGAKNAVAAFKQRGISALNGAMTFLHVKDGLKAIKNNLNIGIKEDDRAIAAIEGVSAKYHEAGRRVKNAGRALSGKDAVQEAKPSGKLAKALEAPFRREKACLLSAVKSVDAAIAKLDRLSEAAKPSVLSSIRDSREQTERRATGMALERPKSREASL